MNKISIIREKAQKTTSKEIAMIINLKPQSVRQIASNNKIKLRIPGEIFHSKNCKKCDTTARYKKSGACVECKKKHNERRYYNINTKWLSMRWI